MMRVRILVPVLACLGVGGVGAQRVSPWAPGDGGRSVGLDIVRSSWDGLEQSFASGLLYASLRVPVTTNLMVVGEVPYARLGVGGLSGSAIGNMYVGVERVAAESAGMLADVGIRLPTASRSGDLGGEAIALGVFSDFDRAEGWIDDFWAVQGHVGYHRIASGGLETGFAVGATLWSSQRADEELFGDYRLYAAYRQAGLALGAEFTGRALLTESGLDVGQRTIHQLTLGVGLAVGAFWPRASIRIPLDSDLKDTGLNHALGLGVDWRF